MNESQREVIECELLWLRCRRGDPEVLEHLIRKLESPLYYFVRRIVANDADSWDVMQHVWISVFAGMSTVSSGSTLKPWIYRTARNTALNHIRANRRYRAAVEEYAELSPEPEEAQSAFDNAEEVHWALDQLELAYREALTLYFLEQMPVRDMAEVLELPEGTVKSRLHHGRRKLRSILERKDGTKS
jgi:RNA polymerase sigma-70 factor (ECF subfamily)